ncbi:MAG: carboxymuconolactone decarboxylase family protein, partial [Gaiellaceae bacterium]
MADRTSFLAEPPAGDEARRLYDEEREEAGYVRNVTRLWCWRPDTYEAFSALRSALMESSALTDRDWAVMVTATASTLGDSYCSLAWAPKLAKLSDAGTAVEVISGVDRPAGLSEREAALADWARRLVRDPNATTEADVDRLREVGLGDREVFEASSFIALRLAFSTVNDALGTGPDRQLAAAAPAPVRDAVGYG